MKCKNLSLNEKIAVLDYAKQHPSQVYRKIAEHFNVSKTATAIILKEEKRLWEEFKFLADDHKKCKYGQYNAINEIIFAWCKKCASAKVFPIKPMLQE